ncbi:MAG: L-rhamnose mutarotase [Actinobacteria bacterium]|nr:L-rhamnose mutarotase [Actinomycetota bacterium]
MKRAAFIFKIKQDLKEEYKQEHDNIWPELVKAMNNCGISNYSIFYSHSDGMLFNYLEIDEDYNKSMNELAKLEIAQKWWQRMDKYFVKSDSTKLGPESKILEEVFYMK